MSNVYPVTSTRRRKGAERGRETSLPGPYETCRTLFKTLTSKVAVLLYVAIFSVYGQAVAQCPTSVTLTTSTPNACTTAGTNTACLTMTATTNVNVQAGTTANFYRNTILIGSVNASTTTNTFTFVWCNAPAGSAGYDVTISNVNGGTCSDVVSGAPSLAITTPGTASLTSFSTSPNPICSGQTTTMTITVQGPVAGTYSITLRNNNTTQSTVYGPFTASGTGTSTAQINVGPLAQTTSYTVTNITTSQGCSNNPNATLTVTVNTPPPIGVLSTNIQSTSNRTCQGSTFQIYATNVGAIAGNVTLTWYKDGVAVIDGPTASGSSISGQGTSTLTVTNSQPGTGNAGDAGSYYVVACSDASQYQACGGGCGSSLPVNIAVNPLPMASFVPGGTNNVCVSSNTTLTVNLTGTGPWDVVYSRASSVGATQTFTVTNNSAGTFNITVPTSTAGATYTYTITQIVDQNCVNLNNQGSSTYVVSNFNVTPAVGQTPIACFGGTTTVSTGTSGATGSVTYTLTGPSGSTTTTTSGNTGYTFTGVTAGAYTLTATNGGCTVTRSVNVTQNPQLTGALVTNSPIRCNGGTTSFTLSMSGGSGGTYSVTFLRNGSYFGGPFTSLAGNTSYTYNPGNATAGTYTLRVTDEANGCTRDVATVIVNEPQQIQVTAIPGVTTVPCYNATTTLAVSATGGAAAGTFTYVLTNGPTPGTISNVPGTATQTFNNVLPGTYIINATDANGCTRSTTVTINNAPQLVIGNVTPTQPTCPAGAGSIAITGVTGGTAPYRYSLNGTTTGATAATNSTSYTFTGVMSGTYTPTVIDANGCTTVWTAITLTAPAAITATVTTSPITCNGGSTTVSIGSITGGNGGNITFTISGTNANTGQPFTTSQAVSAPVPSTVQISGVPAGTYSITANNTGCPANAIGSNLTPVGNLVITQPAPISVTVSAVTYTPTCNPTSGSVTITATSGTNTFTYQLINAANSTIVGTNNTGVFTGLPSGTYNFQITNNTTGCVTQNNITGGQQIFVTVPSSFTMNTASVQNAQCIGGTGSITISGTGGTGTRTFTITDANGVTTVRSGTGSVTFNPAPGTYTLTAVDANGCPATNNAQSITVNPATGTGTADLTINGTAPVNMPAAVTTNVFPNTLGTSMRITYTVTNLSAPLNIAASGVFATIFRPNANFSVALDPAFAENSNWTMTQSGNLYLFRYVGTQSQLPCSTVPTSARFQILFTQNAANGRAAFPLSASVDHAAGDPYIYNNQWTTRLETSQ